MAHSMRARSLGTDDSGAAAVEFALVVAPLIVIVFGIINFGFVFGQQSTINNAVREGARRAVVNEPAGPRSCDGIIASTKNELAALGMDPSKVKLKVTQDFTANEYACGTGFAETTFGTSADNVPCKGSFVGNASQPIIVEAQYVSSLPASFPPFPTTLTLTSKAVYRCEFSQ